MKVEQIYTGCLAQGAYYIESQGEAAIIDPLRDPRPYVDMAARRGAVIKYIFETHFHADFVSGHVDLSRLTGAPIVYGPGAECGFECISAADGQVFTLGEVTITALHTPGHTMESTTFLLKDAASHDHAIFTGDTLFLGDVGRPDLAQKSASMNQEQLAGMLYDSLMTKIMPLADEVIVYPAHGAGSACGKNMMKETVDTLGNQKKVNYALRQPSREAFISEVLDGLTAPPGYFGMNVAMNKGGYESHERVLQRGTEPLAPEAVEAAVEESGALILDVRPASDFAAGHIPRSINIGLRGDFAPWVGAMIADVQQPLVLVVTPGEETEAVNRLSRVGFDRVLGVLSGGMEGWIGSGRETDAVHRVTANGFATSFDPACTRVVDVRKPTEYAAEHVAESYSRPLDGINQWWAGGLPAEPFVLHCAGGYRSMIAASILKSRGVHGFTEVEGGFAAIAKTAVPRTDFVCQSKTVV